MSLLDRLVAALPGIQRDLRTAECAVLESQAALTAAEEEERTAARELLEAEADLARIRADRVALETEADGLLQVLAALREGH